jgi:hypothetical protein
MATMRSRPATCSAHNASVRRAERWIPLSATTVSNTSSAIAAPTSGTSTKNSR